MSSPSIDLDMNLLSSPVPPARVRASRNGDRGGEIGQVQVPSRTENFLVDDTSTLDSFSALNVKRGDENSCPAIAMTSREDSKNTNDVNESTQEETSNERLIASNKSIQNVGSMIQEVESWREELYMMNVKNSILLDDLVKLGADV